MRMEKSFWIRLLIVVISAWALCACSEKKQERVHVEAKANVSLAAHTDEFKREVIKVTDGVYMAVGYGLANSILLEGKDGVVVVDVTESLEAGKDVKREFDKITKKPVKALIYTHNHADHIFGAGAFAEKGKVDVYAHESTVYYMDRILTVVRPIIYTRSMRQFGTFLSDAALVNAGIGPRLRFDASNTVSIIRPNKAFSGKSVDIEVAGIKLHLEHAPGETPDQIFVWMPEKKILLCADNYYKSFPNLYAIRGTSYRDVMDWVRSLDTMRALGAEYLVPSHTRPITGAKKINEVLTNYRDAIQFVHDQTVRGMNQGLTPDELVERVKLPAHLANKPYLHEYYGNVAWSVRSIFSGYLGWFSGNSTDLEPLAPKARAEKFADLAGGKDALLKQAKKAVGKGDHQWALVLTDQLLTLDPDLKDAIDARAAALKAMGERQISANGRHYYLTRALELQKKIELIQPKTSMETAHSIPLKAIFSSMAVNLNPEKSSQTDTVVGFRFPDVKEAYTVHVRRGVAEIQPRFPEKPDITVTVDSKIWKEIAAKVTNPIVAYGKGEIDIEGGKLKLVKFLGLFKAE